jgi:hypothetical protein
MGRHDNSPDPLLFFAPVEKIVRTCSRRGAFSEPKFAIHKKEKTTRYVYKSHGSSAKVTYFADRTGDGMSNAILRTEAFNPLSTRIYPCN